MKNKEQKKEYNSKSDFIHDKIIEVKRATKRKPATMKVIIDDELARRIISDSVAGYFNTDFSVVSLKLIWTEVEDAK